ncbi:DNA metabolism protein [Flavonifractor sp. An82]|uniref:TIGR03915 family putative DNA repair protein n=1 Tax=Flavonifractor sp. An82 TaxID=1965660 RepID=UPI000B39B9CE|nr:TIGR03915 family putative DNA repair protein [Flavonifractor sp. An82]OUN22894.1 DNA metabolism protein [Flavonifractor sp. An82]
MDWPRFSYSYDGSFAGFLTCVFTAYANKEEPACFLGPEEDQAALWPQRTVDTDQQKARRVYRSLDKKLGSQGKRLVTYGFLTCLPQRELCLWDFLKLGYERGPAVVRDLTDPRVAVLGKAVQHLTREAHLLKGFTRFSDQGGALAGEIAPKNRVLPLLRPHFAARYPGETLILYDRTHHEALFCQKGQWAIVPLEEFSLGRPAQGELDYRELWRRFYDTISIEGRYNPKCRMTHMPKRYWGTMTEFQREEPPAPGGHLRPF